MEKKDLADCRKLGDYKKMANIDNFSANFKLYDVHQWFPIPPPPPFLEACFSVLKKISRPEEKKKNTKK